MKNLLILFLTLCVYVQADHLPNYIKPCRIADETCILANGNAAWKKIILGDKNFGIPSLKSLLANKELKVDPHPDFHVLHTDVKLNNFDSFKIISTAYDKELNKLSFTLHNPKYGSDTKYEMKLVNFVGEDIYGKGDFELNILNSTYTLDLYLKTVSKGSLEYYSLNRTTFDFFPERLYFKITNLFDGDVAKGEEANQHINAHWKEYLQEVKQIYNNIMAQLVEQIFSAYFAKVPKSEFFLP